MKASYLRLLGVATLVVAACSPAEDSVVGPSATPPTPLLALGTLGASSANSLASGEFQAAAAMRVRRMDQLGADSASMWSVALTSPTVMAALGIRTATESGCGRTRAETNRPSETSAAANA